MKKELLSIVIKVAIYALGLVAAYLGVNTLTSCIGSKNLQVDGISTIITVDTTFVKHNGFLRTKNYVPN